MKKTSIFALLMICLGFGAKAQNTITTYPSTVWDGMDSITVTYNPFGAGGNSGDTIFQSYTGNLYAYCYIIDSTSAGTATGTYNNGSWGGVVAPIDQFTRVSATEWTWTMPNVRQFFSIPENVYVTGVHIIVKAAGAPPIGSGTDTQANDIVIPVTHAGIFSSVSGQSWTTAPNTIVPTTLLPGSTENVAIYYHPQNDTLNYTSGVDGDTVFKNYSDTVYAYIWGRAFPAVDYPFVPWGSVGATPANKMVKMDTNDYVFDITNLRDNLINAGMPSGSVIDTIGFIPRTASGDTQTANMYIPLVVDTETHVGITNVNSNKTILNVYPNPATTGVIVSYAFAQSANTTIHITNVLGQTVYTQDLGSREQANVFISTEGFAAGTYIVTVSNGSSQLVQRLSKQ